VSDRIEQLIDEKMEEANSVERIITVRLEKSHGISNKMEGNFRPEDPKLYKKLMALFKQYKIRGTDREDLSMDFDFVKGTRIGLDEIDDTLETFEIRDTRFKADLIKLLKGHGIIVQSIPKPKINPSFLKDMENFLKKYTTSKDIISKTMKALRIRTKMHPTRESWHTYMTWAGKKELRLKGKKLKTFERGFKEVMNAHGFSVA